MIRNTIVSILILFACLTEGFTDYRTEEKIAPGVIYYHAYLSRGPWHIHILEIDLTNPAVSVKSAKAKKSVFAREKTSVISEHQNSPGHYIVGAVNADFFEWNGKPVGAQVIDGRLIYQPTNRSVFGITDEGNPFISNVSWKGYFGLSPTPVYDIEGLNKRRNSDGWYMYNHFYKHDTLSTEGGIVLFAQLISEEFSVNDSMEFQIIDKENFTNVITRKDTLAEKVIILVGPSDGETMLSIGDEIFLMNKLHPLEEQVEQLVGGLPRIIRDGCVSVEWEKENIRENFSTTRHPRTSVGYTKDMQKVHFFVVDGRQPGYSSGMTLPELASYMLEWDIYQGINLDGGGSSTMAIEGEIANKPSDLSGERPVANALLVVNTKERTSNLRLNIVPDEIILSPGDKIQFDVNIRDENFLPIKNQVSEIYWSCKPKLGIVDSNGLFTANSFNTSGYLYVQNGMMIDSAKISIADSMQSN
jgi:exopolysaccharide biosynthesis protein